jgi:5-methyltetrahydrofolate--homocysteine methyltransferase
MEAQKTMAKRHLMERLAAGETLVSDGATGTNLQRMGLPVGSPAEVFVLDRPEAILSLNQAFIEAGSDIILTCTFGATRLRLEAAGLQDDFEAINRRAVEISKEATMATDVLVAGSIGPLGHMLAPLGPVPVEEAEVNYAEQAGLLCEAGVDFLVIETQFDLNEAQAAVRGVRSVDPEIPLVCSFSYDRGTRTMMGVKPEQMVATLGELDVDLLGINCGRSLDENLAALQALGQTTDKPIWFKPNAGLPEMDADGTPAYTVSPEEMGRLVPQWVAAGARVVGGCCGTSPDHLAEIAQTAHG